MLELLHNAIAKDVILKEKKIELKETDALFFIFCAFLWFCLAFFTLPQNIFNRQ